MKAYPYLILRTRTPAESGNRGKISPLPRYQNQRKGKEWITMNLPKDPAILLSFVNTHLRDRYPSLEEFCKSTGVPMEEVTDALAAIDYYYQPDRNQFI